MQPGERRIARSGELAPNQSSTVLQCGQASGVKAPGKLMDRPDACKNLHRCLDCAAGDRANFGQGVDGT